MSGCILKVSEAASIAIHSMIILAQRTDERLSLTNIAEILKVSANHLSKVMQRLNKAGLIDSTKGCNGGFKLTKSPEEINFLEIYEIFDGKFTDNHCLLSHDECNNPCIFGNLVESVNSKVKENFEKTYLSAFINGPKNKHFHNN